MDRNGKIWAYSNTGTKAHAFIQSAGEGSKRAVCRASITRSSDATFVRKAMVVGICGACEKKVTAMYDRAEASMQPATESHDLGYVAPAGKFTDTQRDAMQDEFDAVVAAAQAPKADEAETATESHELETATVAKFTDALRDAVQTFSSLRSPIASASSAFGAWAETANLDALHAEALEMDELETARAAAREPQRFHYWAVLATTGGTPLDGIEGYINALDRDAAEAALQERYQTDLIRLTSLHINIA